MRGIALIIVQGHVYRQAQFVRTTSLYEPGPSQHQSDLYPIRAGFVIDPVHWKYSSAGFYYMERESPVPVTPIEW